MIPITPSPCNNMMSKKYIKDAHSLKKHRKKKEKESSCQRLAAAIATLVMTTSTPTNVHQNDASVKVTVHKHHRRPNNQQVRFWVFTLAKVQLQTMPSTRK